MMKSALLFSALAAVSAQTTPPFTACNSTDYYAGLFAAQPDPTQWTQAQVAKLVVDTHRRFLPNVAPVNGDDDILTALVDLYPGVAEETVSLTYRSIDFPAVPAGSPNTWKREDLWPISRGALRSSPALTDAHSKVPADSTVLFVKSALFFGECGTVQAADQCKSPATSETAIDTEQDGKIFTPPMGVRGDIARALLYTQLRYAASLGLSLTDCPPFRQGEFGYLSALLTWHAEDPVSPEEMMRNDRTCSRWQGNRNPFVDYPELVALYFGQPDTIIPGSTVYSQCTTPTNSPTATPNSCSMLKAGDIPVFLMNSDNPDQIVLFPLSDIDSDVGFLYVTDNAWTGSELMTNEGTYRFTVPEAGISAGEAFGLGAGSPYEANWELVGDEASDFELDDEGDQFFVYCLDADDVPNFLWGFSYNGPWSEPGLTVYEKTQSALPTSLENLGNLAIPHADNCVYEGELGGIKTDLQKQFMDPGKFNCLDELRIEILGTQSEPSAAPTTTAAVALVMTALVAMMAL